MSSRKRRIASDPEEDELSPTKSSNQKDIFGTAKKRKLNVRDSPLSSRPSATKSRIIDSLTGLFGFGNGKGKGTEKENAPADQGEDIDELGVEAKINMTRKDVWDVPDDDDPPALRPSSARKGRELAKKTTKVTKAAKKPRTNMIEDSGEDDIEEELPKIPSSRKAKVASTPNSSTKMAEKTLEATSQRGKPKKKIATPVEESNAEESGKEESETVSEPKSRRKLSSTTRRKSAPSSISKSTHKSAQVTPQKGRRKIHTEVEAETADTGAEDSELEVLGSLIRSKSKKETRPISNTDIQRDGNLSKITPRRGRPRKDGGIPTVPRSTPKSSRSKQDVDQWHTLKSYDGSELDIGQKDQTINSLSQSKRGLRKSDIHKKAKQLSREAARKAMSTVALNKNDVDADDEREGQTLLSQRASGRDKLISEDEDELAPPDSHQKANHRRDKDVFVDSPQLPKGILTPSGRKRGPKPRKSVIFQDIEELDLGFKDLPTSVNKKKTDTVEPTSAGEVEISEFEEAEEAESDQSDEIACAVCSGLDETKFNKIILCDGCDFAVHQTCYDLPKVPRGDWYCKTCQSQHDNLLLDPDITTREFNSEIPDIEGFEHHLRVMQTVLLSRLTGNTRMRLLGHDEEMEKVHQVVKQTVLSGEGNSMLVIGARGSGKSTLVDTVIDDLSDHRESFHVVKLNGFIHTDDKLALKDIWRQLGREMEIEDDSKATANDTLQSLLALLSHPSELAETAEGQTTKSVVFILDEFDLFTTHPRQTLLYNLFDIAQARKAPIVVLGLTTRVDVAEALEKRVKSRFSHRYVHLSLPRSVVGFGEICKGGLTANIKDLEVAGYDVGAEGLMELVSFWQTMIDDLYQDALFKHHLETHFYRTKSVPEFLTSCILPVANLSTKNFPLNALAFVSSAMSLSAPDSKLYILQGLSELELAMLVAAARLDIILDTDTCNFAMVYDEYCSLTSRHKIQTSSSGITALGAGAKVWGREVALGAWERLAEYDILIPAGVGGAAARDMGALGRMWRVDVALEEIAGSVVGLSSIMTKWCREI